MSDDDRYGAFPPSFFERFDASDDAAFYDVARFVTHIDDAAMASVSAFYGELGTDGEVLDLCSSWISHLPQRPRRLVALGMNADELARNEQAHDFVVHDLNADPVLPFPDASFDAAVCTVSVDYLIRPFEVFDDVARVLRPGAPFGCTFSNRCFPTKAIRGWLVADDELRVRLVAEYFARSNGWDPPSAAHCNPSASGDPLYAVWARRRTAGA